MEQRWVITAFLDLSNFRIWTYRASIATEVKGKFLDDFYRVLQCYVRSHVGPWMKYEGDGILVAQEFSPEQRQQPKGIRDFILGLRCLTRKVQTVLRNAESSPEGVRIRIMCGDVFKHMVIDPNDPERTRLIPEYLGYCTNTVRGLLGVNPEIPALATEDVVKSLGKTRSVFRVRPHRNPSCYPKGVNREDVDHLSRLKF